MRIIRGLYKGRMLKGYDISGTRPTMSRVKESLFGMIQDHLDGKVVLDLFAGSGNLGFEALSCGASKVWFVDHNQKAVKVIYENASMLGVEQNVTVLCLDYLKALVKLKEAPVVFDLIFLDPPYKDRIISSLLSFIIEYDLIRKDGLVVCEVSAQETPDCGENYTLWKERTYQDKAIFIYKRL